MHHSGRLSAKKQLKGVRLTLLKGPLFHGSWSQRERGAQGRDTQGPAPMTCFLQLHPVLGINCPEYELVGAFPAQALCLCLLSKHCFLEAVC